MDTLTTKRPTQETIIFFCTNKYKSALEIIKVMLFVISMVHFQVIMLFVISIVHYQVISV